MTADITKLVTLILGISISGDRLVTLVKSIVPQLAAPPATGGGQPANSKTEIIRKVILMVIAFLCCYLTAWLINGQKATDFDIASFKLPLWFLGLLASGGSAFWTNILGYVSSLKDLKIQQAFATKYNVNAQLAGCPNAEPAQPRNLLKPNVAAAKTSNTKTVRFTAAFSGGPGTLKVKIAGVTTIDFVNNGFKDIDLEPGNYDYSISGAAATGDGGACMLTITGDVISDSPHKFGQGLITPSLHPLLVTD